MTNRRNYGFEEDDWDRGSQRDRRYSEDYGARRRSEVAGRNTSEARREGVNNRVRREQADDYRPRERSAPVRRTVAPNGAEPPVRGSHSGPPKKKKRRLAPLGWVVILLLAAALIVGGFFAIRGISHAIHKNDLLDVTDALILTSFTLAEGIGVSEETMTVQPQIPPKRVELPLIVFSNKAATNKVCLTFDDGPVPGYTEQYLDILAKYDVPAAFFSLGNSVNAYPELANKIIEAGHELCSHSLQHDVLNRLSEEALANDFAKTSEIFEAVTGKRPKFMRPPYGEYNDTVLNMSRSYRMQALYWSIDTNDWRGYSAETLVNTIVNNLHPGAIILCHEGKQNTLAALPRMIEAVEAQGYEFVSMKDLLANYEKD